VLGGLRDYGNVFHTPVFYGSFHGVGEYTQIKAVGTLRGAR